MKETVSLGELACCGPQRPPVQILREQRHFVLLPQGVRGLPAEVDGSLRGISLQGEPMDLFLFSFLT